MRAAFRPHAITTRGSTRSEEEGGRGEPAAQRPRECRRSANTRRQWAVESIAARQWGDPLCRPDLSGLRSRRYQPPASRTESILRATDDASDTRRRRHVHSCSAQCEYWSCPSATRPVRTPARRPGNTTRSRSASRVPDAGTPLDETTLAPGCVDVNAGRRRRRASYSYGARKRRIDRRPFWESLHPAHSGHAAHLMARHRLRHPHVPHPTHRTHGRTKTEENLK